MKSAVLYLQRAFETDSNQIGCLAYLTASYAALDDWKQANFWGDLLIRKSSIPQKWQLLKTIKKISYPDSGVIIIIDGTYLPLTKKAGCNRNSKKYQIVEYIGVDEEYFCIKNICQGWVPPKKKWYQRLSGKIDYSWAGNIFTSPNGRYRIKKSTVIPGSIIKTGRVITTQNVLGIVEQIWYEVVYESTHSLKIPTNKAVIGLCSLQQERKRIAKLTHLHYIDEKTKVCFAYEEKIDDNGSFN